MTAEWVVRELGHRHVREEVSRRDRLGRGLEEPTERRLEVERHACTDPSAATDTSFQDPAAGPV